MQEFDKIGEDLFNKIRGRFPEVTIGDEAGTVTNEPTMARFFDFDYNGLGKVSVAIEEDEGLTVIYSKDFMEDQDEMTKESWYDFLKELRVFSKKRMMPYSVRDITKSNLNKRDYKFLAKTPEDENMNESKLYGTSRISYQKIGEARIVIKHTEGVNQESAAGRTRSIGKIYIESAEGERFIYPFKHLSGARAMARHVAEGGKPHDEFGGHIVGLSEEMSKLRKFSNYMGRSAVMAESLAGYSDAVNDRIKLVKRTIESLQKPKFYAETVKSFAPAVMEDVPADVKENWIDQLTIKQFNEELSDVFPYIYKLVSEATKATELGPEELEEKMTKLQASKYTCEDCGCQMHNCKPDCDCKHDSNDETGSWWKDENGNGIPDVMEGLGKNKKTKEEIELEAAFEASMGQFSDKVCEECGNPSWRLFDDIEEGEQHGNSSEYDKCWKGYSKVPGKKRGEPGSCKKNEDDTDEGIKLVNPKSGKKIDITTPKGNAEYKKAKAAGDFDDEEVKEDQKTPLGEFILSYYDREEGAFPKGETAILTMVEKDYGEQYINPAKSFIEQVQAKFEEFNGYKDPELMDEGDYEEDDLYTVRKGDTVYSLSKHSGTPVGDIIEINGLDDDAKIQVGQQLRVPGINQIGASPATPGATRGIDPKDNYSKDDFERLVNQGKNEEFNDIKRLAGL